MKLAYSKENPFRIYNDVTIKFDWKDRIRILFGKKAHCNSIIYVEKEVEIAKSTDTTSYAERVFPKKPIIMELKPIQDDEAVV